jgi:carbamoyltransferase
MNLLGIHNGNHDAAACLFRDYELVAAVSLERLTRHKNAGVTADAEMPTAAIDECLAIGGISRRDVDVICSTHSHWNLQTYRLKGRWRVKQLWYRLIGTQRLMPLDKMLRTQQTRNIAAVLAPPRILKRYGFDKASINFSYHHMAHAIPAYFFSEFDDALLYTADGMGDGISFSARDAGPSEIEHLFGTDELWDRYTVNSVGMLYGEFTGALGFRKNRHEGKVTGLAAYGQPKAAGDILRHFKVAPNGEITSDFSSFRAMGEFAAEVCRPLSREDAAASIQDALESLICSAIERLVRSTGRTSVVLGGGVFANVRLNRAVLERTGAERVFVFPAMGDEGLPIGCCLIHLLERDGMKIWQRQRYPLQRLYLGRDHSATFAKAAAALPQIMVATEQPLERAVDALTGGQVVALVTGRMEFGPRALGARSILATPVKAEINATINQRLERSEFMPFAPVVMAEHATTIFDIGPGNVHAARFMTITCDVRPEWRARIPAVVHVDGSARPQILREEDNPLCYRVLELFFRRTGIPVLINTSFNVHEEPIVDTPEQALRSLAGGRVDFILTGEGLYWRRDHP